MKIVSLPDDYVEFHDIPVLRVKSAVREKADYKGKAPSQAFDLLESKLPSLKSRKFYGISRQTFDGKEEYYACVAKIDSDDPEKMQLETGVIPGGKYVRRKIANWEEMIRNGRLPGAIRELAETHEIDEERFIIEYYRSRDELHLLLPVRE